EFMKKKLTALLCAAAVTISALPAIPVFAAAAVSDENGLISAISTGGDYEMTADFSAANAGINTTATTGTLSGNGHTLTKSNSKWGDAILYQNCAGNWTFSDMTIDGSKSTGAFTDAALWYMAGTVKFDNVTIQNFKTSTANRYALNCNGTANMTLNDVTFKDNEDSAAEISPASTDVYIDGGTLHLSGNTTANVYYAGGSIDISSLSKGCNITITANGDNYKTIAAFTAPSAAVTLTADSASRMITITGSDVDYVLSGEKTLSKDGLLTVSATAVSYADEDKTVRVYAAAYDNDNILISAAASDEKELKANSSLSEELTLKASDSDTVALYLWDSATQEPLADKLTVTRIKEDDLLLFYDFENPSDTASMLFGGASVESGKGISGNGLTLNGADGYMQLPNGILSDNMTVSAWIKTTEVQSWSRLFDFGCDNKNNFFYSPSGGRVESKINDVSDTLDLTPFANTGIWEHYAITRTANHVQVYRNGELVAEDDCSNPVTGIREETNYIGKSHYYESNGDKFFCGVMDEIKIYNKICTAEEIKTMYNIYAEKLTADAAYKDYISLDFGTTELTDGTALPSVGDNGSEIRWESTDSSIISGNTIAGPSAGEADKPATLTAMVKNGDTVYTKTFNVTVLAAPSIKGLVDYSMSDVLMTNEYLINANEKMAAYLKKFDVDTSVSGFRRTAGLSSGSVTYGGWETSLIAGHGIGHFVSALAQGYKYSTASAADNELLTLSDEMIDALYEAQAHEDTVVNGQTLKKGYLFATTNAWSGGKVVSGEGQFDNIENNLANITTQAWVPWYTMHKILAGLVDTYKFTGNEKALTMASELGDWVYNRVSKYDSAMQARVLNIEYGGMNDILYELYKITGDEKHAQAAHMFDEITLFDEIYNNNDVLANKHANTTIPKIMGALNRYITEENTDLTPEMLGDSHDKEYYLQVAENFFDMVVDGHTYVTGGTGQDEHFRAANANNAYRDNVNNETCAAYNMLKIARELYKITGDKKYSDYYENTFLNSIVSSQNPETGMTMYFQPMATGYFKVYSTEFNDFWCCTASGMENFTKLTDSIYYKGDGRIVVNQYISSALTDTDNNIRLTQNSSLPDGDTAGFTVEPISGSSQLAAITLRIPEWTAAEPTIKVNGEAISYTRSAGYVSVEREWKQGDTLEITLPMEIRAYGLADSDTVEAFKY
ncbi:MAG: beta-L-arabinofuranosidase domain-containing protein, partial [Candidatus Ornithomonoglobus sp.]